MSFYKNEIFADKFFYHIYPLGLSNAPRNNNFSQPAGNVFEVLESDLDRIKNLGVNALYIGPLFESTKHGYDTIDYYYVDRRLGNNEKFKNFCKIAHEKGFSIVLDAVFNHTGRDFFAFRDLIQNGKNSQYKDWFMNINFDRKSFFGDNFDYDGWAGCMDLVKLNLKNTDVQNHIFGAVNFWLEEFNIDGLRLDAADVMDKAFLDKLGSFCKSKKADFWLMGEVVHGDYNDWTRAGRIDSVTNYQIYNSLWASVNEHNFFDLSYNLNREFSSEKGLYRYAPLYTFLDNHDVNRLGSVLKNPQRQLYMIYGLMFAIPGIPSVYYGSEFGLKGVRNNEGDYQLRPSLPPFNPVPDFARPDFDSRFLPEAIRCFAQVRKASKALQIGDYKEVFVSNKQFVFARNYVSLNGEKESVLIFCNCDSVDAEFALNDDLLRQNVYSLNGNTNELHCVDLLSGKEVNGNNIKYLKISPFDIKMYKF